MEDGFMTIVGGERIGDKMRGLLQHGPQLARLGFGMSHRTVLAEEYLVAALERNGLPGSLAGAEQVADISDQIIRMDLSFMEETLEQICGGYMGWPLAVRSSAAGDGMGIGKYESVFVENDVDQLTQGIKTVFASYFSSRARAFRKRRGLEHEFGIGIERITGQKISYGLLVDGDDRRITAVEDDLICYAPLLSGWGIINEPGSDPAREPFRGKVVLDAGLAGGVESSDSNSIDLRPNSFDYSRFDQLIAYYFCPHDHSEQEYGAIGKTYFNGLNAYIGKAFFPAQGTFAAGVHRAKLRSDDFKQQLYEIPIPFVHDIFVELSKAYDTSKYFEFAVAFDSESGQYSTHITQISDYDDSIKDVVLYERLEDRLFVCSGASGTGRKDCSKIVVCSDAAGLDALSAFNEANEDYVLICPAVISSKSSTIQVGRRLEFDDYSNASVVIPYVNPRYQGGSKLYAHFTHAINQAGMLFGVLNSPEGLDSLGRLMVGGYVDPNNVEQINLHLTIYTSPVACIRTRDSPALIVYKAGSPLIPE